MTDAIAALMNREKAGNIFSSKVQIRRTDGDTLWYKHWAIAHWEKPLELMVLYDWMLPQLNHQYPTLYAIERTQKELKHWIEKAPGIDFVVRGPVVKKIII